MSASRELLLATRNAGKLRELQPMFAAAGWLAVTLSEAGLSEMPEEDALEVFDTFEENALAKARYFASRSGLPVVADDSGLSVEALAGEPGVRSRRWSGRTDLHGPLLDAANNTKLLAALAHIPNRVARFVCVAAFVRGEVELIGRGEVEGVITERGRGLHGFGYDPFFEARELGRTFGEATIEEKSGISHRARAVAALLAVMRNSVPVG